MAPGASGRSSLRAQRLPATAGAFQAPGEPWTEMERALQASIRFDKLLLQAHRSENLRIIIFGSKWQEPLGVAIGPPTRCTTHDSLCFAAPSKSPAATAPAWGLALWRGTVALRDGTSRAEDELGGTPKANQFGEGGLRILRRYFIL